MCGILFTLQTTPAEAQDPALEELIRRRGPDATDTHRHEATTGQTLSFTSSLLSLRGRKTVQPLVDRPSSSVLCWNGETWRLDGYSLDPGVNDSEVVLKHLMGAEEGRIDEVVGQIDGEYAFVYYDAVRGVVWFGRDWLGRRSLLMQETDSGLSVASVGIGEEWVEVDAGGIWRVELGTAKKTFVTTVQQGTMKGEVIYDIPTMNMEIPPSRHSLTMDSPEATELKKVLTESIHLRVRDIPKPPSPGNVDKPVRLAILFSGGLDCTMLARIAHTVFPLDEPIDLLNVAFENPRVVAAAAKESKKQNNPMQNGSADPYALCPDRTTGLSSYQELVRTCPDRSWHFVAINIPYAEVIEHKPTIIKLMAPHNTEMDLSIAMAFYFAARGRTADGYTTPARILFSGLGADELLAGYTRHATAFSRGYEGLIKELELDFQRLGKRNLGRDDRVLAHWGREARYPFLDQRVVEWAMRVPVHEKCGFGEDGKDEKGKKVLRLLAKEMGMQGVSCEKKRAVQFGTRSAKMEVDAGRRKGTDGI